MGAGRVILTPEREKVEVPSAFFTETTQVHADRLPQKAVQVPKIDEEEWSEGETSYVPGSKKRWQDRFF